MKHIKTFEQFVNESKETKAKTLDHKVLDLAIDSGFNFPAAEKIADKFTNKTSEDFKDRDAAYKFANNVGHGNNGFIEKLFKLITRK